MSSVAVVVKYCCFCCKELFVCFDPSAAVSVVRNCCLFVCLFVVAVVVGAAVSVSVVSHCLFVCFDPGAGFSVVRNC